MEKIPEHHPLEPFLPENARILMLGSFPPKQLRWSMDFFYPNFINDMWRIMGVLFFDDRNYFVIGKAFDRSKVVDFCTKQGIALYDTATCVIRHKDNASDKFLEIINQTNIAELLGRIPHCTTIVTTGEKATETIVAQLKCAQPAVGEYTDTVVAGRDIRLYRMPSSSRAYPLPLGKKAEFYKKVF